MDYDGYGTDPLQSTVFIPIYNQPQVRRIVQAQLQSMADLGATFVDTNIWLENLGQSQSGDIENFPLTDQQAANLRAYAQDVAAVQGANGNRLRLNIALSWLAASDFTIGSPSTGLGSSNLSAAQFTANVQTTIDRVLGAISNVNRPDGVLVVDTVFLDGEIALPAPWSTGAFEENSGWFMTTNYPYFVSGASKAGVRPSVYFGAGCEEDIVFDDSWFDSDYPPILNGHRSMAGVYTGVKFMVDNGLPLPTGHIDFDCYMDPPGAPYEQILQRVLDDADAVLPSLGAPQFYFMPETYYLADPTVRLQYGQAFATQAAQSSRLQQVSFWAAAGTNKEIRNNVVPFTIEDFLPPPGPTTAGLAPPQGGQPVNVANASTLTTIASYFLYPGGVAVDRAGNVYVADTENNAVREIVAATGAVKTLASGFNTPGGVAVDAAGNVYVADTFNNAVREIVPATGAVNTLGSGFNTPEGVAVDGAGNVYVADMGNNGVKEIVAATGAINTLGSGFNQPFGVAVDAAGNVYVGDSGNDAVKEIVAATGVIETLASGSGVGLLFPEGVAVDTAGNVYVADSGNNGVMEIVAANGDVIVLGSPSSGGFAGPSGVAVDAAGDVYVADTFNNAVKEIVVATEAVETLSSGFFEPLGVAVDSAGDVYVADTFNNAVKEIVAATGVIKTLGSGFNQPNGVAVDGAGNVYVADTFNSAVKEIVAATGAVKTLSSSFSFPEGVAVDGAGNVYVADMGNGAVKEIVAATGAVNALGSGFNTPGAVAVDAAGNVYVADMGNNAVKEIVAATGAVNTLGSGFDVPGGVAVDAAGNVYVADTFNNAVKEIVAATGAVVTLGSGFRFPSGVAVGGNGSVYVIDYENVWEFTPSGQMNSVPKRPLRKNPSGRVERPVAQPAVATHSRSLP